MYNTTTTPALAATGAAFMGVDLIWIGVAALTVILVGIALSKFVPKKQV